jgi:transposase
MHKAMNKKQIANELGMSVSTLVRWMSSIPELKQFVKKRGTGSYLYTSAEIDNIFLFFRNKM